MPVPLILCRLKDDHDTTMMIGETALFHFPDWEAVPDDEDAPEPSDAKSSEPPKDEPGVKAPAKTTRKAAPSAEKDKE